MFFLTNDIFQWDKITNYFTCIVTTKTNEYSRLKKYSIVKDHKKEVNLAEI